ncbi:MAG TPA: phosphoglucosamine mutase [Acidimicrobiales bacterium]|nr:phosphoglucosamine mutase [Acidimicrobiales bacterium]
MIRFGTDGLRGVANADLTTEVAMSLGRAAARTLPAATYLVGRDTRRSGPMLQAALSAGLAAEGVDVVDLGVLTTPGVAYCSERRGVPAAMVSASHNPFSDNGIKLFGPGGTKLAVETEVAIERMMVPGAGTGPAGPTGGGVGRISEDRGAAASYRAHLAESLDGRRLDGLRVVLDCANGAATAVAPATFEEAGAEVTAIACAPDGTNINHQCGSTHPEALAAAVVSHGADLGLAFDGDADRLVAVDHTGTVADGDTLLALFAVDLARRGELSGNAVVVTVMTNLGFRLAMADRGIEVRETPVGDRHVLAALEAEGLALGGEQSGHIVFRRRATTGDGILTGLVLADLVVRADRPLAELSAGLVERVPQVLANVAVTDPGRLASAAEVWATVSAVEAELDGSGRVLLRPSGTEPLVRVMVEAVSEERARAAADRLCEAVQGALGAGPG